MSVRQTYSCLQHGTFWVDVGIKRIPSPSLPCPKCSRDSRLTFNRDHPLRNSQFMEDTEKRYGQAGIPVQMFGKKWKPHKS